MNRIFYLVFLTVILFSCNSKKVKNNDNLVTNDNVSNSETIKEKDLIKEKKKLDPNLFPVEYVIIETGPGCDELEYRFYSDSSVLVKELFYENSYLIGNWNFRNDTIYMNFLIHSGKRGLGEQEVPEGMESVETCMEYPYDSYCNFYYFINKNTIIPISKIDNWYRIDSTKFASQFDIEKAKFEIHGDYPTASMKILDSLELNKFSKKELRLMRNEIFARYNYIFKSEDLRLHFGPKEWYMPENNNIDSYLTDIEKKNIELIIKLEKAKN